MKTFILRESRLTSWEGRPIFPPFRPPRGALLREAFEGWDGMRYPCAWLATLTPGHIQRAAAGQTCRGETPVWSGRRERESGAMPRGAPRCRRRIRARMRQASCARSPGNTRAATAKSVARRPWRATPSHWGRRKGRGLRADPGARTKPGDVNVRLLGSLTIVNMEAATGRFGGGRDVSACSALMERRCSNVLPPPLLAPKGMGLWHCHA